MPIRTWLFRGLLRVCPRSFRDQFGEDLLATSAALDRDRPARLSQWLLLGADAIRTLWGLHREMRFEARATSGSRPRVLTRLRATLESIGVDAVRALRGLARSPRFAGTTIGVLAVGVGVTTAVFSLFVAVMMRPLDGRDPDRLRLISADFGKNLLPALSYQQYEAVAAVHDVFDNVAFTERDSAAWTDGSRDAGLVGELVSGNYFDAFGVAPERGRAIQADDGRADAAPVAVISDGVWHRLFRGDPAIIGRHITLRPTWPRISDDPTQTYTIVGVMPASFRGQTVSWSATEYWVPVLVRANDYACLKNPRFLDSRGGQPVVRLRDGVTDAQAQTALDALTPSLRRFNPNRPDWARWALTLRRTSGAFSLPFPLAKGATTDQFVAGVFIVAGLLLTIVLFNTSGLLAARAVARRQQVALRLLLGATRARVVREMLTETILLSLAGGLAGFGLQRLLVTAVVARLPTEVGRLSRAVTVDVPWADIRTVVFATVLCAVVAMFAGIGPAIRASRAVKPASLVNGVTGAVGAGAGARSRFRLWIVIPQLALSLALLMSAGVLVRALIASATADRSYSTDHVAYVSFDLPGDSLCRDWDAVSYRDQRTRFRANLDAAIGVMPNVSDWALTMMLPWQQLIGTHVTTREMYSAHVQPVFVHENYLSGGYANALRIPIVAGRTFEDRDRNGPRVAVINQAMAERLWPWGDAVSRSIATYFPDSVGEPPWAEVIGVLANTREGEVDPTPMLYLSSDNGPIDGLIARLRDESPKTLAALAQAIHQAAPGATVYSADTANNALRDITEPQRISAELLGAAGVLGLVLALMGLYAVIAYAVSARTQEIGIRTALGAGRGDILALFTREALTVGAIGLAIGLGLGIAGLRLAGGVFAGTPRADVTTSSLLVLALGGIVLVACLVPARRATTIDPVEALRRL